MSAPSSKLTVTMHPTSQQPGKSATAEGRNKRPLRSLTMIPGGGKIMRTMRMAALAVIMTLAFSSLGMARDHDDDDHWRRDRHHDHDKDRDHDRRRDHERHEQWER